LLVVGSIGQVGELSLLVVGVEDLLLRVFKIRLQDKD